MKGIYLCSCVDKHPDFDLVTNDIRPNVGADIVGDCMEIDLTPYDYIVASPPCNFWSYANATYLTSKYSLQTKHLLPDLLEKLSILGKPFIVENVRNDVRFTKYGVYDIGNKAGLFVHKIGRHTYWTNVLFDFYEQFECEFIKNKSSRDESRQGSYQVHRVIESWLKTTIQN